MNKLWKPQMKPCEVCGKEFLATHSRSLYCPECKKTKKRESNTKRRARHRAKERLLNNETVDLREIHYCDTPENVKKCLNCTRPKCTNCLRDTESFRKSPRYVISEETKLKVVDFVKQGMKQKEIAKQFGVSEPTVSRWVSGLRVDGAL